MYCLSSHGIGPRPSSVLYLYRCTSCWIENMILYNCVGSSTPVLRIRFSESKCIHAEPIERLCRTPSESILQAIELRVPRCKIQFGVGLNSVAVSPSRPSPGPTVTSQFSVTSGTWYCSKPLISQVRSSPCQKKRPSMQMAPKT